MSYRMASEIFDTPIHLIKSKIFGRLSHVELYLGYFQKYNDVRYLVCIITATLRIEHIENLMTEESNELLDPVPMKGEEKIAPLGKGIIIYINNLLSKVREILDLVNGNAQLVKIIDMLENWRDRISELLEQENLLDSE